jgi:hypothetical protein
MKRKLIFILFLGVTVLCLHSTRKKQPNIVFLLVDDLGWTDVSCYGSSFYETTNIDALAEAGVRFTNQSTYYVKVEKLF